MSRNQHIPQYCGSCWAHGAVSALADRVKIARRAQGIDINPSVQHLLDCGGVGSCHGGTMDGPYQWLHSISAQGHGISFESSQPYLACSSESKEGFCPHVDTTCKPVNLARPCGSFSQEGCPCSGLASYPNVSISDYGSISGADAMMKEIYHRGPISCGIDAVPLLNYESGIIKTKGDGVDHVISVVGWGTAVVMQDATRDESHGGGSEGRADDEASHSRSQSSILSGSSGTVSSQVGHALIPNVTRHREPRHGHDAGQRAEAVQPSRPDAEMLCLPCVLDGDEALLEQAGGHDLHGRRVGQCFAPNHTALLR